MPNAERARPRRGRCARARRCRAACRAGPMPSMKSKAKPFQPPRRTSRSPFDDAARDAQDERPGEIGRGLGQHVRRVGHHDAARAGRGHVDVVVADGHRGHDCAGPSRLRSTVVVHRVGEHRHQRLLAAHAARPELAAMSGSPSFRSTSQASSRRAIARDGKPAGDEDCRVWTRVQRKALDRPEKPGAWSLELPSMSVRLAVAAVVAGHRRLDHARPVRVHARRAARTVRGSGWARSRAHRTADARRRRRGSRRPHARVARDRVAHQRPQFLFGHSCTSTLSTMPMMAASTGARFFAQRLAGGAPLDHDQHVLVHARSHRVYGQQRWRRAARRRGRSAAQGGAWRPRTAGASAWPRRCRRRARAARAAYSTSQWSTMPTTPASAGTSTG